MRFWQRLNSFINNYSGKENYLSSEIRPSPTGVAGAEPVPSKKRGFDTWLETDIDNNRTRDRGPDTELQLVQENKVNKKMRKYLPTKFIRLENKRK